MATKAKKVKKSRKKPQDDDAWLDAAMAEAGLAPEPQTMESAGGALPQMMSAGGGSMAPNGAKPRERRVLTSASGPRRKDAAPAAAPTRPMPMPAAAPAPRAPTFETAAPRVPAAPAPVPAPASKKPPPKHVPPPPKPVTPPADNDDEDDGAYSEDDFEDYDDDDFEDDGDGDDDDDTPPAPVVPAKPPPKSMLPTQKTSAAIQPQKPAAVVQPPPQPLAQEPQRVLPTPSWMDVGPPPLGEEDRVDRPPLSAMNLKMSMPYTANRFEQAPMSEFQLLERRMGNFAANSSKETQTAQDSAVTVGIQTEDDSAQTDVSAQVGGDESDLLSGGGSILTGSGPARLRRDFDPARLSVFLRAASQVVTSLLGERELAKEAAKDRDIDIAQGNRSITAGCVSLPIPPVGGVRSVRDVTFSRYQQSTLFVAYGPAEKGDMPSAAGGKGLLCIWDTGSVRRPSHTLICESNPRLCCFSGHRLSQTVFAATEDNSLVVWDLREPASMHISLQLNNTGEKMTLRRPTYSTDGLLEDSHTGSICSMEAITPTADTDEVSFQLAMLDENGGLSIWNVVELGSRDMAGSFQDFCLGVGGKVKLMKSAFIDVSNASLMRTLAIQFRPGDPNHLLVGTGHGYTTHIVRHGATSYPAQYESYYKDVCDVHSIQHSPFLHQYFLTCSNDGSICLYHEDSTHPLHSWADFTCAPLVGAVWSPSQPHVFFAYTKEGDVFAWDLLKNPDEAVHSQRLAANSMSSTGYNEHEDNSMVKVVFSARGVGHPFMATSYANGCTSVHTLTGGYSDSTVNDVRRMRAFLEGVDWEDLPEEASPAASPVKSADAEPESDLFMDDNFMDANVFGDFGGMAPPAREGRRATKGRRARNTDDD